MFIDITILQRRGLLSGRNFYVFLAQDTAQSREIRYSPGKRLVCYVVSVIEDDHPASLLEVRGLTKSFGPAKALKGVDLDVRPGEVHCVLGQNGAGKSTLVKIIAGNFHPTEGTIRIDGQPVSLHGPKDARLKGIEIVHQDLALADNLTAAANIFLGREKINRFGVLDYRGMYQRAAELFAELKSETRPRDVVRRMSGGQRQAVAIARTRLSNPKIVLMDEPFSHLDAVTRLDLQDLAARLLAGRTVVLVTHDPLEALRLGHQIRVISGSPFAAGPALEPPGAVPRDPADPALLALQAELISALRSTTP